MTSFLKDGAMGSWLRAQGYSGWLEALNLAQPQVILAVHRAYRAAGAQGLTTNSFCATLDLQPEAEALAYAAAVLARQVAGEGRVLGSLGPGGRSPQRGDVSVAQLAEDYRAPARGLIMGGVDLLWLETCIDPFQLQAAVHACQTECLAAGITLPIWGLLALRDAHHLVGGTPLSEALAHIRALGLSGIGLNCTEPELLLPAFEQVASLELPLACVPNAGMLVQGQYGIGPEAFTQVLHSLHAQFPLTWMGGCCGTTPAHIQRLSQAF
jgi:5-methyltetrahydrofolate--homocysteine methyltransferase